MPFNGSGTYAAPSSPGAFNPAISGQTATPTAWNTFLADFQTAMSTMICRDGQSTVTDDIPFNDNKITGLGNATLRDDAANAGQVQDGSFIYAIDTGAADAYVMTPTPSIAAYVVGQIFRSKLTHANATTTPTLVVSGLTAGLIKYPDGSALPIGTLAVDGVYEFAVASVTAGTPVFYLQTIAKPPVYVAGTQTVTGDKTFSGAVTLSGNTTITGGTNTFTGTVAATSVLANGVTGTTQAAADNSTKVATTAYVDAAVGTNPRVVAMCKATGTTRDKQFNVASVVKNSTGNFTFNFTSNIDADAVIEATARDAAASGDTVIVSQSASAVTIQSYDAAGTPQDYTGINFTAFA